MASLNPKKWSVVCWLLLLLWLFASVAMNAPFEPNLDQWQRTQEFIDLSDDTDFRPNFDMAVYGPPVHIGWPFCYLKILSGKPKASVYKYKPLMGVLNSLAIITTLASIVYAAQNWIPRFSIRVLLSGVTLIAVLIATGQAVFATNQYETQTTFMMSVYFSPIVAAMAHLGYSTMRLGKQDAG